MASAESELLITWKEALNKLKCLSFPNSTPYEINISNALNYVLGEDIYSDIDMPPFNKSAMDGYACRKADLEDMLKVIETIPAGKTPINQITKGKCSKIMTGAIVPEGADCVIMVEHTKILPDGYIKFTKEDSKLNICIKGEDLRKGELVLKKGDLITPAHIGLAASVGKTKISVNRPAKISVLASGTELVEPEKQPMGPFIRNSNSYNIVSQLANTPAQVQYLGIIKDDKNKLEQCIDEALKSSDIIIITGGVSMGDHDYIPDILSTLGLEILFQKMAIQPGKPVTFGFLEDKFCFGLSGNPVSSYLQFELLVRPFIYYYMNHDYKVPIFKTKLLSGLSRKKTNRMQFFPVIQNNGSVEAIQFNGSAHLAGLINAVGFGLFPVGSAQLEAGCEIDVLML